MVFKEDIKWESVLSWFSDSYNGYEYSDIYLRISRNRRKKNVYEYPQMCKRYKENGVQNKRILEYSEALSNESDVEIYRKALHPQVRSSP